MSARNLILEELVVLHHSPDTECDCACDVILIGTAEYTDEGSM